MAGTSGLSPSDAQQQAIDTLFGGPAPRSLGEMTLLDQANRGMAPIGIRSTVWDPDTRIVDKGATTLNILSAGLRTATSRRRRPASKRQTGTRIFENG